MTSKRRTVWINWEISNILIPEFGAGNVEWDWEDYMWVMIKNFKLPRGWSKPTVPLLIEIPRTYPDALPKEVGFYTEKRLTDRKGFATSHYFQEMGSLNKYADRGWAWLCIHVNKWNPKTDIRKGDNLMTICNLIHNTLSTGK